MHPHHYSNIHKSNDFFPPSVIYYIARFEISFFSRTDNFKFSALYILVSEYHASLVNIVPENKIKNKYATISHQIFGYSNITKSVSCAMILNEKNKLLANNTAMHISFKYKI